MINDSGTRREFESGAVRDCAEGKGRCDLMPLDVVAYVIDDDILDDIAAFIDTGIGLFLRNALERFAKVYDSVYDMMLEVSIHFEDGAKKYGEYNWQKGIPESSYIDSAVRHYLKFRAGMDDERHDRAFVWNILCLMWQHRQNRKEKEKVSPEE